jgi:hypothetical protein
MQLQASVRIKFYELIITVVYYKLRILTIFLKGSMDRHTDAIPLANKLYFEIVKRKLTIDKKYTFV